MTRPYKPGSGQWALDLGPEGEPPKKPRRKLVYIYTDATSDGAFVLRTPDLEEVQDLMHRLRIYGYYMRIKKGTVIAARHLADFVAACQAEGWYVRVKPYAAAPA